MEALFYSETSGSEDITNLISKLPKQKWLEVYQLCQWKGYWYAPAFLEAIFTAQSHFKARDDDIILTSLPKAGTTWLKSLVSTIVNLPQDDAADSLTKNNPHDVVETLEISIFVKGRTPDLSSIPSSRIFHTHIPYSQLPDSIKSSKCKLVYITRNPKDMLVSFWHFMNAVRNPEQGALPIEIAFESFCQGSRVFGPTFEHVLEYWKESMISGEKIHFMKYEELKRKPKEEIKKLASFLGRPLLSDEEVDNILKRCSFERLKNLEVNKTGFIELNGRPHSSFFRNGAV